MNPILKWALFSRFKVLQQLAVSRINPTGSTFTPSGSSVSIMTCGDMSFDSEYRLPPGVYRTTANPANRMSLRHKIWRRFCRYMFLPEFLYLQVDHPYVELLYKDTKNEKIEHISDFYDTRVDIDVAGAATDLKYFNPFKKIKSVFKHKDVVWANLETPLSHSTRAYGFFISDPRYVGMIKDAGISLVCLANNHIFDAGEVGFEDTIKHLERAGIAYTGAGRNFETARTGHSLQVKGIKLGFLSYTQYCNANFASVAAVHSGILPLDAEKIIEDIHTIKQKADFALVSLHWGIINQHSIHRKQVVLAHRLIDAGADVIVGHSPHVPHGIEIYKGKPILYSLGNFIFPYDRTQWSDNFLAEIVIDRSRIEGIAIHPISGKGQDLFQPEILQGARADKLLHDLQMKSAVFKTGIAIDNHTGYIKLSDPS